jgi:hypothetical protein
VKEIMNWEFDQPKNCAALTTRFVLEDDFPVLVVEHFEDDHSWAFLCGTTDLEDDARVISMEEIIDRDKTLVEIANLKPGYRAYRVNINSEWMIKES